MHEKPLFGKFEIIKCYKKDDSLAVYLADHIYLSKKIILKTLNTSTIADQVVLERFKREAKLLAKINHSNIISVYDFGMYEEYFYISFEYFESQNLRQAFSDNSWTIDDKINILNQIATGLSETHYKKIIHRDLKPENILINDNNEVKIADFGLAQVSGGEKLTAAEAVVGTPAYMTPEQIRGLDTDERSDLFSFGILIYEMFFGVNPFLGKDAGQTLNNIQTCRINTPPPHSGMPEYIPIIIDGLLKKNQSDRPKSVNFIFDFTGQKKETNKPQKKSKIKYIVSTFLILSIITIIVFIENNSKDQSQHISDGSSIQEASETEKTVPDSLNISSREPETIKVKSKPIVSNKLSAKEENIPQPTSLSMPAAAVYGYIDVNCKPWANVLLDSILIDTTPFKEPYRILAGKHILQLQHPDYPQYTSEISVLESDTFRINVNLDNLVGYLICNVFPWGDIYVDENFKGQTPMKNPIIIKPGKHILEIKNPEYENQKSEIEIIKSDTLKLTIQLKPGFDSN